jgi:hypothetical protein
MTSAIADPTIARANVPNASQEGTAPRGERPQAQDTIPITPWITMTAPASRSAPRLVLSLVTMTKRWPSA